MPNKPKEHRCPKPGCDRVYKQRPDYIAHFGKCVLGVFDALKCPNCPMGFSNRHKWNTHKRSCKPNRSLLLPLEQRIKKDMDYEYLLEYDESTEEHLEEHLKTDDEDYDDVDYKEFIIIPKRETISQLPVPYIETERGKTPCKKLKENNVIKESHVSITIPKRETISQLSVPEIESERGKALCEELKRSMWELPEDVTKSAYIYMLVDPRTENFCNGIFYISEGDSMQPLDHLRDAVEARRGSDHVLVMTDNNKVQSNALAKIDKIWSIWNSGRGVGVVKPIEFLSKYQAATYEACLMSHMWLQLKNVNEGTLYGIAANWSQEEQSDVAEYLLKIIETLVNLTGLREIRLEDVDLENRDEDL